jgi:hypothetical protein
LFLLAAVVALAEGGTADFVRVLATFAVLVVVRLLDLPRLFDLAGIVGMALQAFDNALGVFTSFGPYDLVVHLVLSMAVAPTLYILLARLEVVPDLTDVRGHRQAGVFHVTFLLGLSVGPLYEIYEYAADHWLAASLVVGYSDTISDLVDDVVASAVAGAFLVLWAEHGWGMMRRLPAERVPPRRTGGANRASQHGT